MCNQRWTAILDGWPVSELGLSNIELLDGWPCFVGLLQDYESSDWFQSDVEEELVKLKEDDHTDQQQQQQQPFDLVKLVECKWSSFV